jgi:hypothetical protein
VIANVHRDAKKQPKPYQPTDFMPYWQKPEMTEDQIAAKVAAALGAPG